MFDTLIIIPAYNEEGNIGKVLKDISCLKIDADVLVINDGSNDRTRDIVLTNNSRVISHPYNLGYGAALQTGFKYAVSANYKHVIQFDGDGQHDPNDICKIVEVLKSKEADIVIGSRFIELGSFRASIVKMVAIEIFRFLIKVITGQSITDPTSGIQGLSRRVFSYYSRMGNFPKDFPDADILIHMIRSNFKVYEISANIRPRHYGESMHNGLKPVYYFLKIMLSIIVVILRKKVPMEV